MTRRPSGWRRSWRPAVNRPSKRPIGCAAFICVPSIRNWSCLWRTRSLPQAGASVFAANLRLDKADALYETAGRRPDALAEYLAVYQAYPDHDVAALALYNAAFAALDLKQYDQALDLADQFLKRFADNALAPDARYIVAECQIQKKDYVDGRVALPLADRRIAGASREGSLAGPARSGRVPAEELPGGDRYCSRRSLRNWPRPTRRPKRST